MVRSVSLAMLYGAAFFAMIWPGLWNGQYFWFHDSLAYLSGGQQAVNLVWPFASALGDALATTRIGIAAEFAEISGGAKDTVAGGRSVYYGALIFLTGAIGTLWLGVALQTLLLMAVIHIALWPVLARQCFAIPIVMIFVGVATAASFFTVYLMPDIFAPIAILASASLIAFWQNHSVPARIFLTVAVALSCMFHNSHILLVFLILVISAAVQVFTRIPDFMRSASVIAASIIIGLGAIVATSIATERNLGKRLASPPFLTARVLADGPGVAYLADSCPNSGFVLCARLDHLPVDSDTFLWSTDPERGIYKSLSFPEREALRDEQVRFVIGAVSFAPEAQILASTGNFMSQLVMFDVTEFAYSPGLLADLSARLPKDIAGKAQESRLGRSVFDLAAVSRAQLGIVIIAMAGLLLVFANPTLRISVFTPNAPKGLGLFAFLIIFGIVANAAVTGILSTPHDRYAARVIWLLPLLAAVLFLTTRKETP